MQFLLPLMIINIYIGLQAVDRKVVDAARTLGANPAQAFLAVTFPLALPGLAAGCLLTFILAMGAYITPIILGGPGTTYYANLVFETFVSHQDWPFGATLSLVIISFLSSDCSATPSSPASRPCSARCADDAPSRVSIAARLSLTLLTYLFMLAPALVVVVLAFNSSPSSTFPMAGLTLRWFADLAQDAGSAAVRCGTRWCLATCGQHAVNALWDRGGASLSRFRFAGRAPIQLLLTVPLLVPHIVLGVGLLLAFRLFGLAKSFPLLVVGHMAITLPLRRADDRPSAPRHSGQYRGGRPHARRQSDCRPFCAITLPLALPAVLASLLFAFMSSFDEVTATLFWLPANMQTVPSQIMAMLQFSVDQKINALAAVLILGSVVLAGLALVLGRALPRRLNRAEAAT